MKEIRFVDVGEGITEGRIQKWLVKDGESVSEDQAVVQVETDKAVVNVPAPISGKISISAKEGALVHVGDLIAAIGTDAELQNASASAQGVPQAQAAVPTAHQVQAAPQPQQARAGRGPTETIATPAVRKLARDLGINLLEISGTGPGGRILENDVRSIAHQAAGQARPIPKFSEVLEESHSADVERIPLSQTRKAIARNMEASWTIPRAVHMDKIDATALFDVVQREKPRVLQEMGVKLTVLPFVIKAVIKALLENPNFNASYDHEKLEIVVKKYYNIGLAAEAPDGLKVAVVKGADSKSIIEIARSIQELGKKVRERTISLGEMQDSTFTVSNIGSLGGGYFSVPMINYPEVAILGIHLIRDEPVVREGKIEIRKVLPFSLVFDHRVVDGAEAVKFGNALIKYLEDPDFLEMV